MHDLVKDATGVDFYAMNDDLEGARYHARGIETSTFDIFQGKTLEFLSQPRQILRG